MRRWIRVLYRLLFRNIVIRFIWMLSVAVWGVKWATNTYLADKNTFFAKTIFSVSPNDVSALTIRKGDIEMVFAPTESGWLVVQNNVIIPISADTVALYLNVLKKLESHLVVKLPDVPPMEENSGGDSEKPEIVVIVNLKGNVTDSLSIFYTKKDSASGNIYTYVKKTNERLLHGVRADMYDVYSKNFESLRNRDLLTFNRADIVKMTFQGPIDTVSFWAQNTQLWTCNKKEYAISHDSLNQYIQNINRFLPKPSSQAKSIFYDGTRDFIEPKNIDNQLVIYTLTDSMILSTYRRENAYLLHSSQNEDSFFRLDSAYTVIKKPTAFLKRL